MGRAVSDKNLTMMKKYRDTIYEQDLRKSINVPGPGHYYPTENDITSFTSKNKSNIPRLNLNKNLNGTFNGS